MNKIAIVVGHTGKHGGDRGAASPYLKRTEWDYNSEVALSLKSIAPGMYDVHTHKLQGYYKRQLAMSQKLNAGGYSLAVELHFNAAVSPTANGTYCLYWYGSKKAKAIAQGLSAEIVREYGTKLRAVGGAQALVNEQDRGYWFTALTSMPAIIVEPFFGSSEEALRFQDTQRYACVLHNYLKGWKK
jgi:N-acetylmuramoyl-L-alanine amidase